MPQFPDRSDQLDVIYAPGFATLEPELRNEATWVESLLNDKQLPVELSLSIAQRIDPLNERINNVVIPLIETSINSLSEVMIRVSDVRKTNQILGGLKYILGQLEDNKMTPKLIDYLLLIKIVLFKLQFLANIHSLRGQADLVEIKLAVSELVQAWATFEAARASLT